jgi:hypothetical protein
MNIDELRELCAMTVELTRLRQNECKHLAIENFAPELLGKLLRERQEARHLVSVSSIDIEKMLVECVPGGSMCDPQEVADNIRRYCNAWPSA